MATYGAKLAARHAMGEEVHAYDNRAMSWVLFSDPQVAGVLQGCCLLRRFFARSVRKCYRADLLNHDISAAYTWSGPQHHEATPGIMAGNDGGDDGAFSISLRVRSHVKPASTSVAKSALGAPFRPGLLPPTPRSSTRNPTMPRRVSASARTRNGLCPNTVSSLSCAPEPVISKTTGKGPPFSGKVSVPANRTFAWRRLR